MINQLLDEPYFNSDLFSYQDKLSHKGSLHESDIYLIIFNLLITYEKRSSQATVIYANSGVRNEGSKAVSEYVEKNIKDVESYALDLIFYRYIEMRRKTDSSEQECLVMYNKFMLGKLTEKCEVLEMTGYLKDRNLETIFKRFSELQEYSSSNEGDNL